MIDLLNISKLALLIVFCHLSVEQATAQIEISITGSWNNSVPATNITEAGTDFTGTYASNSNQVIVDITNGGFLANYLLNYAWRVDIRKSDVDWNSNLLLYVRRTGNGNPFWSFIPGTITGGTTYQQLTNANQSFFSGTRSRLDVPIQYQISGVSVLIPAKTYTTTVVYTVTEL